MIKMPLQAVSCLIIYFVLNILYSFGLKNIPILDVAIIVLGFIIRVLFGAILLGIEMSNWLYLTILSLSFYLALGKRRGEISNGNNKTREVLNYYNKDFLDKNMYTFLAISIVFYSLWATDVTMVANTQNKLIWTIPFMIIICMKYSLTVEGDSHGDPVEVLLSDKVLMALVLLYVLVMGICILV